MKAGFKPATAGVFFLALASHQSAVSANVVPYTATGTFNFGFSEASDFDGNFVDSFAAAEPISYPSTFTLRFDLDTSADGDVPGGFVTGGIPARFDNAVSNISLDISGITVISDMESTPTLTQFDRFDGAVPEFSSRWDFGLSPTDTSPWALPPVTVLTQDPDDEFVFNETELVAGFLNFALFDSTGEVYDGFPFTNEVLQPELSLFDSTSLRIFWELDDSFFDEDCFDEECEVLTDVFYTAFGTVDNISAVPVPAAAWLFGSALLALAVPRRRQRKA